MKNIKTKANKLLCGLLASTMCFGTVMPSTTAYAVTNTEPVNQDGTTPNWNKPQDTVSDDQSQYANQGVRLLVSKTKTATGKHEGLFPLSYQLEKDTRPRSTADSTDTNGQYANTVTYKISGRVEGTIPALEEKYGTGNIEFAYSNAGIYLGYGWHKGTLEYLLNRKAANFDEDLKFDIVYNEGVFTGYAYVTRALETADNDNRFVAGANMALYEAIEITRDNTIKNDGLDVGEDHRFNGVEVTRNSDGTVEDIRVKKGHAGTTQVYVYQKDGVDKLTVDTYGYVINKNYNPEDQINDLKGGTWIEKTVQKEDTPILYYNLDNLHITTNDIYTKDTVDKIFGSERKNKDSVLYGFDKNRNVIDATQLKETDFSIYGFVGDETKPTYEFVGGDFNEIKYNEQEKRITVGKDTLIYHLDEDGNRDSLVDPQTGIAYIEESIDNGKNAAHDNIHDVNNADDKTVKDTKIYVWPVNISYDGSGSTSGNKNGSKTFSKILGTRIATINADKENEYTTGTYENGQFAHRLYPMLDLYGRTIYYKQSSETYVKGQDTWDYDGDVYTGWKYTDILDKQNLNAYTINDHDTLYNGDKDDPFDQSTHYQYSTVQEIKLTVDSNGYIVNGAATVPVPRKENAGFKGWIISDVNSLTDGMDIYPSWDNNPNKGMSESMKEKWYSSKTATGTTRTVTVKFHANSSGDGDSGKAEFVSGSGDIHSTDNKLYRRLGDAYLIYDKWVSGENTPNDPFDTTLVDTVENTAANSNTLTANGKTSNDPYSDTMFGGMADMLKRVALGDYIMEEVSAPLGYVKGLPVGVTVNYSSEVQTAEMEDQTIKLELVKVDAPDKDLTKYQLYVDGTLQKTSADVPITTTEHKAGFTYKEVTGAVFAITGKDDASKAALSSWAKVTSHPRVTTKMGDDGYAYIEVGLDTPLVMEGFPAGTYLATEVQTPKGAVTMEPTEFTVKEETGVQFKGFSDDHMKVEVEKYYLTSNEAIAHLDNARRAQLGLYDSEGHEISTWWTDDLSDYKNTGSKASASILSKLANAFRSLIGQTSTDEMTFEERFKEAFKADKTFTSIGWTVTRTAEKLSSSTDETQTWLLSDGTKVVCSYYSAPDDAPEGFKEAYKNIDSTVTMFEYSDKLTATKDEDRSLTDSDMYWNCSNGSVIHIAAYTDESNSNNLYSYEFEYNYQDLSDVSENLVSYDKTTGIHRFDYLPKGEYVIKEITAPEGFVKADNKAITVDETSDVQRFMYQNKRRDLSVAKYAYVNDTYYAGNDNGNAEITDDEAHAAVIPGVKFEAYYSESKVQDYEKAFANGIPANLKLVDSFETGKDGKYTENDYKSNLITSDKIGDYKPHTIKDVENGYYYIVEKSASSGYKLASVVETHVTDSAADSAMNVVVVDNVLPVKVKVVKEDENGARLEGAGFTIVNKTLGDTKVGYFETNANGEGSVTIDSPYYYDADGTLNPYTFEISETKAPEGYAVTDQTYTFTANPEVLEDGVSLTSFENGVITYVDTPTTISITKADFDTLGEVPGTKFTVYEAEQSADGKWTVTNTTKAGWSWETKKDHPEHQLNDLAANKTYALVETEVPDGYTKADTIFFTINGKGSAIEKTWTGENENHAISFDMDESGAVTSVSFTSRQLLGATLTGTNVTTGKTFTTGLDNSGYVTLGKTELTTAGNYQLDINLSYTDGTKETIATTNISVTSEDETMKVKLPVTINNKNAVSYTVTNANTGKEVAKWTLDSKYANLNAVHKVSNPMNGDGSVLSYYEGKNYMGKDSSAAFAGKTIAYVLTYTGDGQNDTDIQVKSSSNMTITHIDNDSAEKYRKNDDGYYYLKGSKDGGTLIVTAQVRKDATGGYGEFTAVVNGRVLTRINPIAMNRDKNTDKTGKLLIANEVNGTDTGNESATFTYELTLTKAGTENALSGGYDWRTKSTSGMFQAFGKQKTFTFTLTGNDYLLMSDLPSGAEYSVKQIDADGKYNVTTAGSIEGTVSSEDYIISYATFKNERNVTSDRTVFQKDGSYIVTETLNLTDDDTRDLTKYGFKINDNDAAYNLIVLNKQTEVWFSKTDWTDCKEVPGASCTLYEQNESGEWVPAVVNGQTISWVSGDEPVKFKGTLTAGKTYRYVEVGPPTGYAYTEAIEFTVSTDGRIDKVVMRDKATSVSFTKTDYAGKEVPGAEVELKGYYVNGEPAAVTTPNGEWKTIDAWTSTQDCVEHPHVIEGELTPGMTYRYHEEAAPDGYYYSEDIEFTLDNNGIVTDAHYIDKDGTTIIYDKDGYPMDDIKVTTVDGVSSYIYGDDTLVEKDGALYKVTDGTEELVQGTEGFRIQIDVVDNVVQMKDAITQVTFTKKDFAGEEVPGADVELKHYDKTKKTWETVERWTSEETNTETGTVNDHVISGKLTPGETYRYHEEATPDGYYYSEDIEFTLDNKGNVTDAHYIDKDGNIIAYDENGYPLEVVTIKRNDDGTSTYYYDGEEVTEENGTLKKGDVVLVENIKVDIPIVNNVVEMLDAPIKVKLQKERANTNGQVLLSGGIFSIAEKVSGKLVKENFKIDETLDLTAELRAGVTYLLKEITAPDGFEKADDVEFSVPTYNTDNVVTVKMEDPRKGLTPSYTMDKVRVTSAPEKLSTGTYGFYHGDTVSYKVTIENTGDMQLSMTVADAFGYDDDTEETKKLRSYFTTPVAGDATFYKYDVKENKKGERDSSLGKQTAKNADGSTNITLEVGGMAEIVYTATVKDTAPEFLASTAEDDRTKDDGYKNTATVKNVTGKITTTKPGDDKDKTYTKEDFPELDDKKDTADTPVQVLVPSYEMSKERVDDAPIKDETSQYGFFRGSNVDYNVTVKNTGEMDLTLDVTDKFDDSIASYFSTPYITAVKFYDANGENINIGTNNGYADPVADSEGTVLGNNKVNIGIKVGGYAVITYRAKVSDTAAELLSNAAKDDGNGYLNIAKTTNVTGTYEDSNKKTHTVDKDTEYPVDPKNPDGDKYKPLEDKEDTAHTPVQLNLAPSYTLTKRRVDDAKLKGGTTDKYGFDRGDTVKYEVVVTNTGELPIVTYVEDQFEDSVKKYFNELQIESITFKNTEDGSDGTGDIITENGCGVGFTKAHIRIPVGQKVVLMYSAKVANTAPENLANAAPDDGNGYLNIAKTIEPYGEVPPTTPDGPGTEIKLDPKEDDAHTPVKVPVPGYTMTKVRTSDASQKSGTTKYGFKRGDTVTYKVTVVNTGDMDLKMLVDDAFTEHPEYFSTPSVDSVTFYKSVDDTHTYDAEYGSIEEKENAGVGKDSVYISLNIGGTAEITFKSTVQTNAIEYLAPTAADNKEDDNDGYRNTANVTDVTGTYTDGNGKHTVDKDTEYPVDPENPDGDKYKPLEDKKDTADTPVQVPKELVPNYKLTKERITAAPFKGYDENGKAQYGFRAGDVVEYKVTVTNTGEMKIYTEVDDQFEEAARKYFDTPVISDIKFLDNNDKETKDAGNVKDDANVIGQNDAAIYIAVGCKAVITYKTTVTSSAQELLSFAENAEDYGYVNTARATNSHGEPPEETTEKPPLPPTDDTEKTPVQTPDPSYTMQKRRITEAPVKVTDAETKEYGFRHGDTVTYKVTIQNTGTMQLVMDVEDHFNSDVAEYFTTPVLTGADFYSKTGLQTSAAGKLNSAITESPANITVEAGCSAELTYTATVLESAPEYLAPAAADNRNKDDGYRNTATTKNVKAYYTDGKGEVHEFTSKTYEDKPGENPLRDKEDIADTPVQKETQNTPEPKYDIKKERTTKAPEKANGKFGFKRGEEVTYKVTVNNNGTTKLTMDVEDHFDADVAAYFTTPKLKGINFYAKDDERNTSAAGTVNSQTETGANITLEAGSKAVFTYTATVLNTAPEYLADAAADDKSTRDDGYGNTATTTNVIAKYIDASGTEHTITKEDYPDTPEKDNPLKDKEDTADTPVQENEQPPKPEYEMTKKRVNDAPEKADGKFGFKHGEEVTYKVTVNNKGTTKLTMDVEDHFDADVAAYFTTPKLKGVDFYSKTGMLSNAAGTVNTQTETGANITLEAGSKAVFTYTATVLNTAPEYLAGAAADDKSTRDDGYGNTATTTNVIAKYIDAEGNEHTITKEDYPDTPEKDNPLKDKEDTADTPVQENEQPPKPEYEMSKKRVSKASEKATNKFGFKYGEEVTYQVTVNNTGTTKLTMDVEDHFDADVAAYFTTPKLKGVDFYGITGMLSNTSGTVNTQTETGANITIDAGCKAILTYRATVLNTAPEYLAPTAADDKSTRDDGYGNTATTTNVIAKYLDASGTEHTITKEDYPDTPEKDNPLKDKEDTADTPVRETTETPTPGYKLTKERITPASAKLNSDGKFGFWANEKVLYKVVVENTGNIKIETTVSDEFENDIAEYFKDLKIEAPENGSAIVFTDKDGNANDSMGEVVETSGMGIGTDKVKIRLEAGGRAEIYYTAIVSDTAKELLASAASSKDDPTGYKNIAKAKDTTTVPPDDTTHREELPPKEDEDHTPVQEPQPSYTMTKERITLAPEKADGKFGFKHGSTVSYLVTVKNTGETVLTMNVDDTFNGIASEYFSTPLISEVAFANGSLIETDGMGVGTNKAHITLDQGGEAKITYTAKVLDTAPESLALAATDDGSGYKNTATVKDVTSTYETPDGEKHTKTEKDYPDDTPDNPNPLKPKDDEAHTPVQTPTPDYAIEKERILDAPKKNSTKYGFYRNSIVTYEVNVTNTGTMDLEMLVNDAFDTSISKYFQDLKITGVKFVDKTTGNENTSLGSLLTRDGTGVGTTKAFIALKQNGKAIITYTAKISSNAQEKLSNAAKDDGRGYLNTATATEVTGKYEDGEGKTIKVTKDDFDTLKDKSDTANTPVQVPSSGGGGGGDVDYYGKIVIYKYDGETSKSLEGATFEIYYPDGSLYKTVTTGSNGEASVKIYTTGTYSYKEIKAPTGYELDSETHELTVSSYSTYTARVANTKTPPEEPPVVVPPTTPEEHNEKPAKGKITVHYTTSTDGNGNGWFDSDGKFHKLPTPTKYKTGDDFDLTLVILTSLAGLSLIGCGLCLMRRKKEEDQA